MVLVFITALGSKQERALTFRSGDSGHGVQDQGELMQVRDPRDVDTSGGL